MMILLDLVLGDLLDRQPVAGAETTVFLDVVGRWPERITPDNVRPEMDRVGITLPKGGVNVLMPDFDRAERLSQTRISDDKGAVTMRFDADAAFAHVSNLRRNGVGPTDVGALLSAHVRVDTLESEVRYLDGVMSETAVDFFGRHQAVSRFVPVDFGKSIVGHVADTEARIFFRIHALVTPGKVFVCEVIRDHLDSGATTQQEMQVDPVVSGLNLDTAHSELAASVQIDPDISRANTGVARISGLQPATSYQYTLYLRSNADADVAGGGRPLLRGSFRTGDPDAKSLEFAFVSCHNPAELGSGALRASMRAWSNLSMRSDYELLLLMGDQIYGDGIELPDSPITWTQRYLHRYDRFWVYPELRQVLRRTPTYMILDDHDVVDDYGVKPSSEIVGGAQRVSGALEAYETFQQSLGPDGPGGLAGPKFYRFRRGPAAFFMIDNRTQRAAKPEQSAAPILGGAQRNALTAWAREVVTSNVDIIFVVAPVPIAFLPVEEIQRLRRCSSTARSNRARVRLPLYRRVPASSAARKTTEEVKDSNLSPGSEARP